jgi:hypothetical protein
MNKPHIGIVFPDYFPENFSELITSDIIDERLNIEIHREESHLMACFEWAIPGIIAAYIFKPYFESFLKEAGKDHYKLLKLSLSKLLRFTKDAPIRTITADSSTSKIDLNNSQSKAISIYFQLKDNRKIKLLFDNNLLIDDWLKSLDTFLNIMNDHYMNFPFDDLSKRLNNLEKESNHEIFAIIDFETKVWTFKDINMIIKDKFEKQQ